MNYKKPWYLLFIVLLTLLVGSCQNVPVDGEVGLPRENGETQVVDPDEDENLPFDNTPFSLSDLVVTPPPPPVAVTHSDNSKSFRAATWNLKTWFDGKANQVFAISGKSGIDTLFDSLDRFGIDIIALQEVYASSQNFQIPPAQLGQYNIDHGQIIFSGTSRNELCPIVWNRLIMKCTPQGGGLTPGQWSSGGRDIHWVHCTMTSNQSAQFYFGCAHFSPRVAARDNIKDFFVNLVDRNKRPAITSVANGNFRDNFILGLDANSHPNGHYGSTSWEVARTDFNKAVGSTPANETQQLVPFSKPSHAHAADMGVPANKPFTKIYKRGNTIKVTRNDSKRTIDDLISSTRSPVERIANTKQVLPVEKIALPSFQNQLQGNPATGTAPDTAPFWLAYDEFSDHLPISEDFNY
jgi:hypothetical protein